MPSERVAKLPLNCGEFTCAARKGEWCRFLRTINMGGDCMCSLFEQQPDIVAGWTMRLPDCLRATGDAPEVPQYQWCVKCEQRLTACSCKWPEPAVSPPR